MLFPAKRVAVLPRRFPAGMPMADGRAPAWWMDFVNRKHYYNRQHATAEQIIAALGGSFTRASTAYSYDLFGKLVSSASNVLRRDYDPVTLAPKGILLEGARTIIPLYNRDFTNGAWTPTNVTAAKNQIGIDGVSNAASSLTATASDGTILQTVTTASTQRAQAAYVKRLVGTGTVEMTMDGGSTWTDITSAINGSTYTRVPTGAGLVQTLANPNMGFRIRTSGDSIAVDFFTNEAGAFVSSPVATTSVSATRAADVLTFPTSPWFNASAGTFFAKVNAVSRDLTNYPAIVRAENASSGRIVLGYYPTTNRLGAAIFNDAGVTQADVNVTTTVPPNSIACAFATNDMIVCVDGALSTQDTSVTLPTSMTTVLLTAAGTYASIWLGKLGYWPFRVTNAELQRLTGPLS